MKSRASLMAMLAIAAASLLGAATGCELIASVDRQKIETGGAGGTGGTTASGGTTATGASAGTGGTGGMTTTCDPAKCPPPSAECKEAYCDDMNMCAERNVQDGTDATSQTTGDCKKLVCQGGVATPMNDDTDVFDDMNACTDDTCDNGSPTSTPTGAGSACAENGGKLCDGNGVCVACLMDSDCTDPNNPSCSAANNCIPATCNDNKLNGDETDKDCGGSCDPCADNLACKIPGDCQSGVCTGLVCQVPTCNDNVKNGTESDQDCGGSCNTKCGPSLGCNGDADCVGNQCTAQMNGTCVPNCSDQVKNNAETDKDCGGGTCGGCAVGLVCSGQDSNCIATAYCDSGTDKCVAKVANGQPCVSNNMCTSNACADGVCCNNACNGVCQACNVAGNVGTCSPVPVGTDPAMECPGNGGSDVCDGSGACAKGQGTTCAAGGECANGSCVDGVCCESACSAVCKACSNAKTGQPSGTCANVTMNTDPDNECVGSLSCTGAGACSATLANGAACTVGGECTSGNCVDGVCCNSACGAACQACSATKKGSGNDGVCGFIGTGTDPDNECAGALSCNGAGACNNNIGASCGAANECQSGNCVDGVCCNNTCTGLCNSCNLAGKVGTCSPILAGDDPANECSGGGGNDCNGAGACGLGATGSPCEPAAGGMVCAGPATCPAGGICP